MYIYCKEDVIEYPFSLFELRNLYPNISFPNPIDDQTLAEYYVYKVEENNPEYDPETHYLNELPPQLIEGVWKQRWEVLPREIQIPNFVTKRQGRQQMILLGLLDQVQTAIDSIPDPIQKALVQSFWDDSTQYERNHPQMIQLSEAVGMTEEQLDGAFIAASQL